MPRAFVAVVLLAAVACSDGDPGATPTPTRSVSPVPSGALVVRSAPAAKMASGTSFVRGVLVSWCEGEDCRRDPRAVSPRAVPGEENGVLLFQVSVVPTSARVEVRDRGGRVVAEGALEPGTTMAFAGRLGRGRFLVNLVARFGEREGRWVFGLDGPLGERRR